MKIIVFIILLISIPAKVKAPPGGGGRGGGGGGGGIGGGFGGGRGGIGSGFGLGKPVGYSRGEESREDNPEKPAPDNSAYPAIGDGYRGGSGEIIEAPGGEDDPMIIVVPKPLPEDPPKVVPTIPPECKPEVKDCITKYVIGDAGWPKYKGPCCEKLRNSVPCVCKFLLSEDLTLKKNSNGVLKGCRYSKPNCIKLPMPQTCKKTVRHCVNVHVYGNGGTPKHRGACCRKFKSARFCICKFLKSNDPKLTDSAERIMKGCHFLNSCRHLD